MSSGAPKTTSPSALHRKGAWGSPVVTQGRLPYLYPPVQPPRTTTHTPWVGDPWWGSGSVRCLWVRLVLLLPHRSPVHSVPRQSDVGRALEAKLRFPRSWGGPPNSPLLSKIFLYYQRSSSRSPSGTPDPSPSFLDPDLDPSRPTTGVSDVGGRCETRTPGIVGVRCSRHWRVGWGGGGD